MCCEVACAIYRVDVGALSPVVINSACGIYMHTCIRINVTT